MRLALVGRHDVLLEYCREHSIDPRDRSKVVLISDPHHVFGLTGPLDVREVGPAIRGVAIALDHLDVVNATAPRQEEA